MSTHSSTAAAPARTQTEWRTSGLIQLTRPQTIGTLSGLMLSMLLAALDQTIVGTAEPRIIASLSGFDRYPWVSTAYLLGGIQWIFLISAVLMVALSAMNLLLKDVPLRHGPAPSSEPPAH